VSSVAARFTKAHKRDHRHVEAWTGGYRPYDLVKELVVAVAVIVVLTAILAALFSSPDDQPVTIARWARADAKDFTTAALSELNGTSEVAQYGPPYNSTPGAAQKIGPISLQTIPGVRIPIETANDLVLQPLQSVAGDSPPLQAALNQYRAASPAQQTAWTDAYGKALNSATFSGGQVQVPSGNYGPVAVIMAHELALARSGGLDGALLATKQFYQTDYTKPILFISAGSYFEDLASSHNLLGEQWGMMNETGNWPGQPWLWLYTFWYQIPPFATSGNADALIWGIMALLSVVLVLVPFIPGVRSIPRWIPIYKLVWRDYYRGLASR
jgi:hypothetical protein